MTGLFSKLNKRLPRRTASSDSVPIARVIHNEAVPDNATPEQLTELVTRPLAPLEQQREIAQLVEDAKPNPWAPLGELLNDPAITDLFISHPEGISCRKSGMHNTSNITLTEPQYRAIIEDVECQLKARCKESLNFLMGPVSMPVAGRISLTHPTLNGTEWFSLHLRIPRVSPTFYDLIKTKMIPTSLASWVTEALATRCIHVAVCGSPQSGKTTLTATLVHATPSEERIVALEPAVELLPPSRKLERLCQRHAADASATLGTAAWGGLLEIALRSAPDRIVATSLIPSTGFDTPTTDITRRLLQSSIPSIFEFTSASAETVAEHLAGFASPLPIIVLETQLHERNPVVRQVLEVADRTVKELVLFYEVRDGKRVWVRCPAEQSLIRDLLLRRGHELKLGSTLLDGFPNNE